MRNVKSNVTMDVVDVTDVREEGEVGGVRSEE